MNFFPFLKKLAPVVLPLFMLTAVGCTDDDATTTNGTVQSLSDGNWVISYYFDKDKEETNDFFNYTFLFHNDGTFESLTNNISTTGTWQITSEDGSQRLVITSGSASKPLSDLDDDWIIMDKSDNKIKLRDDNDEHLEELFFEKI